jgi:hypothetical protein
MTDLTKWPRLIVAGVPVTEDQADNILIRTSCLWFLHVNDQQWNRTVARILNIDLDTHGFHTAASVRDTNTRLGILDLQYLHTSRIASSWIGGPHGWCDWTGAIGCSNYNIGKWPSTEDVTADWQTIAAAFPFLDLTAQLVTEEGDGEFVAEWRVVNGTVEQREPTGLVAAGTELGEADFMRCLMMGGERGVTPERLQAAVARVEAQR